MRKIREAFCSKIYIFTVSVVIGKDLLPLLLLDFFFFAHERRLSDGGGDGGGGGGDGNGGLIGAASAGGIVVFLPSQHVVSARTHHFRRHAREASTTLFVSNPPDFMGLPAQKEKWEHEYESEEDGEAALGALTCWRSTTVVLDRNKSPW